MVRLRITGPVIPFGRANVDTDLIIPASYMKTLTREGLGDGAFAALRGTPGNVFDDPCYRGAPILVAGANFGCGSSREHAVWALLQIGVEAVIAPSFGEIFETNALRNGLVPVTVAERVELGLFAKNLFNQYGILNAPFSFAGSVTRPRTIGATVRFSLD